MWKNNKSYTMQTQSREADATLISDKVDLRPKKKKKEHFITIEGTTQ